MSTLSKKYRSLISDIIFNQDFDADDIQHQIMRDYVKQFDVDLFAGVAA